MITQIKEPDNVPGLDISTSYQRQNEWLRLLNRGKNTIVPTKASFGPYILIPIGGVVEINGKLFQKLTTESLTLPNPIEKPLYVAVTDRGNDTATFSLSDTQGLFNYAKWGYYMPGNQNTRILEGAVAEPNVNTGPSPKWETEVIITGKDVNSNGETTVQLTHGLKQITILSGAGGNTGSNGTNASGGVNGINGGDGVASYRSFQTFEYFVDRKDINIFTVKLGGDGKPLVNNTKLPTVIAGNGSTPLYSSTGGAPGMPCIRGFASSFNSFDKYQLEVESPVPLDFTIKSGISNNSGNLPAINCEKNNYFFTNDRGAKGFKLIRSTGRTTSCGFYSFNGLDINFPDNNLNYSAEILIRKQVE